MASDPRIPSLEWLRKQAKALLRSAHAADAAALTRVRRAPRLAALDDRALAQAVQLADAQHAVALEQGTTSWAELRRQIEEAQPMAAQVERFLTAVRDELRPRARRLLARFPAMTRADVRVACAAGDATALSEALARDPALAVARDEHGFPPLLYVCASPLPPEDPRVAAALVRCAEALLAAGATPNDHMLFGAPDRADPIPALYFACVSDHRALVRLLLERGADPNDGESVYHAAERNHTECLELLLAHGADLGSAHAHWRNTPLYFLTGYRNDDQPRTVTATAGIHWLLEHGADPNVPSQAAAETPLHLAAGGGRSAAFVEMLLAHGADPDRARADGRTPLALAIRTDNAPVVALLRAHGARGDAVTPVDELLGACMRGDESTARAHLARDPGLVAAAGDDGYDVLTRAAEEGRERAVRLMARLGFDVGREGPTSSGTPLHRAAWHGRPEVVRALIELGAPLDVRDREFGSAPLGWAAHGSRYCRSDDEAYRAVIAALIDAGATREAASNQWGAGPASLASPAVAAFLEARGSGG